MKFQVYRTLNYQPNYEKLLETYPALANYNLKRDNAGNSYITITSIKQLTQFVKKLIKKLSYLQLIMESKSMMNIENKED